MERFGRIQIHNCQFEVTIGVTLAALIDGRVSCLVMETQSHPYYSKRSPCPH